MSLDEYFSTGPARERPIFDAVHAHVSTLGPIVVEPVSVGILVKRSRTIIELRPKTSWVALSIKLPRVVVHPRIARRIDIGRLTCHVVNVREPEEIDDVVCAWLTEAYVADGLPGNPVPPPR